MLKLKINWPPKLKKPKQMLFIRHGQTNFNLTHAAQGWLNTNLNANGLKQAEKVSQILAKKEIDFIFSSDLKRAFQTAWVINQHHSLKIIKTPLLRERHLGLLTGQELHLKNTFLPRPMLDLDFEMLESWNQDLNMEPRLEFYQRIKAFLFKFLPQYPIDNKIVLVVSHGGTLNISLKILQARLPKKWYFDNTQIVALNLK